MDFAHLIGYHGIDEATPLRLASMSVFMDQFRLAELLIWCADPDRRDRLSVAIRFGRGRGIELVELVVKNLELVSAKQELYEDWSVSSTVVGNTTFEQVEVEGHPSWIPDSTFLEHLKASPYVRQLWGRIPGGLAAGTYNLTFPVNSPIWTEAWGLDAKRVIFSQTSEISQLGRSRRGTAGEGPDGFPWFWTMPGVELMDTDGC
eukprot:Skav217066  [mRNA]  locus=scaffold208:494733:501077:+ [translate_table: standard]